MSAPNTAAPGRIADLPVPAKSRSARLFWAMLLSLFTAGLGQVYLGRFRAGILLVGFDVGLDLVGIVLMHRPPSGRGLALMGLVLVCVTVLRIGALVMVARGGAPTGSLRKTAFWQNAWLIFVLVVVCNRGAGFLLPQDMRSFTIPSGSMIPTLQIGDDVFADTSPGSVSRGDVVFFTAPSDPATIYVKRVIALAGDHVRMQGGQVILNGQALPRGATTETNLEGRSYQVNPAPGPFDTTGEITVPDGAMFVLGDNRANSLDSRAPSVGAVPVANIIGHGGIIYWARDRSRILAPVR
jgi:signal peptidase I